MDVIAGFGLDRSERERLSAALGLDNYLVCIEPSAPPEEWVAHSSVLFVPWRVWKVLDPERRKLLQRAENLPLVLVLPPDQPLQPREVESISSSGFLAVLCGLEPQPIREVLDKGREAHLVMSDILCMTREIGLERELLARKNDQLEFLSRVLTSVSETLDLDTILARSREELQNLLPVSQLSALFWKPLAKGLLEAELYLPGNGSREVQDGWIEYLLSGAARVANRSVSCYHLNFAPCRGEATAPLAGSSMLLPLKAGPETFGVLALASDALPTLGRDTLQTLNAAVSHMALALKNGVAYNNVRKIADHDGLTRIHNRQHFDQTILVELKRHQRQGQALSLLMLDLDRFKAINDSYGHQAGDLVLTEMGRLLATTLRETDYPARYGGEEFVAILPHTTEKQAWNLAERIRKRLAAKRFEFRGRVFRVTTSIGVAGVAPNSLHLPGELIRLADQALYRAKAGGRNMVCLSAPPTESSLAC